MKHHLIALAAALIFAAFGTQESQAKVTVKERTIYYSVSGRTGKDIYAQIARKGPKLAGRSGSHVATSTISFDFRNFQGGVKGNRCVFTGVDVLVNVVYRVPKWNGRGNPGVKRAWDSFIGHVWRHEHRHRDIGVEYAKRLESGIKGVTGDARRNCNGFETKARQLVTRSRAWHDRKQKAFDTSWFGDGGRQFKYDKALVAAK